MTIQPDTCLRTPTDERDGRDQQEYVGLAWVETVTSWCWETVCGKYRIERFIPGDYEFIGCPAAPERFRVLKRTPEWWSEICGSETDIDVAKALCEENRGQ